MKNRHNYYLANKAHIKAKSKEYYLVHKNDDDFKANVALRRRRHYKENKARKEFDREFELLKAKVAYLEAVLYIHKVL